MRLQTIDSSNVLTPPFQNTATYVAGDSAKHHHHICHQHAHAIAPVLCSAIPSNIVCPNAKQIFQTGSAPHFHNILAHTSISTSQNIPDQDLYIPWCLRHNKQSTVTYTKVATSCGYLQERANACRVNLLAGNNHTIDCLATQYLTIRSVLLNWSPTIVHSIL